jgi:hypothetical protein
MMEDQKTPLQKRPQVWVGIGLAIGAGVGLALHDLPLGIGAGMLVGAIISIMQKRKNDQEKVKEE